jgi:hypothetical protein
VCRLPTAKSSQRPRERKTFSRRQKIDNRHAFSAVPCNLLPVLYSSELFSLPHFHAGAKATNNSQAGTFVNEYFMDSIFSEREREGKGHKYENENVSLVVVVLCSKKLLFFPSRIIF